MRLFLWYVPRTPSTGLRRNVGTLDAALRLIGGLVVLLHALLAIESAVASFVELTGALILLATTLTRICPVYELFRRATRSEVEENPE